MSEAHSEIVKVALTVEEFVCFAHWCERKGLSQSAALRMALRDALHRDDALPCETEKVPK